MTTALDKALRREINIEDKAYTLTIDPQGLKLVEKGRRNGTEIAWRDLVGGDADPTVLAQQAALRHR